MPLAGMLRNYFKIAWRNLIRNKAFSSINILGLALGLTCSLLILLWVQDERSVDAFHSNGDQLYQVFERRSYDGKTEANYLTQGLLAEELKKAIPEVANASSMEVNNRYTFEAGDKIYKSEGTFASTDFFKMFSYPLLQGAVSGAPNTISISRKMAEQFFGSVALAVGQTIRYENKEDLLVTAVFENIRANSSQQFDFLRNWSDYTRDNAWVSTWNSAGPATYIQLRKDADPAKVADKIRGFISKYDKYLELGLQPYPEKYLHSTFKNGQIDGGRIEYVRLFSLVAIFILLIACINFMNLATARSAQRAKEVGVRKVVGAQRSSLIAQFVGEAVLLTFISIVMAVVLAAFLLPVFNNFTGKQLTLPFTQPVFWLLLFAMLILTGFTAGSYPALFLSSLNPLRVLKGSLRLGTGTTFFRKSLVVFQFSLSVILILGMIIIYRQINYVQTRNLGYDRENLIYIPLEGDLLTKYELFKKEAAQMPGIVSMSKMRESPTVIGHQKGGIGWEGKDPNLEVFFSDAAVAYDFVKTMRLSLVAGRDFSESFGTDASSFLVNETAVKKMGYKDPIGKSFYWDGHPGNIIGVLKDFHFNSMHQSIEPLFVRLDLTPKWGTILVRTSNTKQALASLEQLCKTFNPKFPFLYQFSDQEFDKLYKSEQIVSRLTGYFAFLAIFISCLGLFGLATFAAAQRTKEIGVRKVLGASVPDIITLLSTDILKPVAVSLLIGFPVSWYIMNQWLQDYAYKINIEWWMFALAAILTIGIAILTVSFQSVKAALMNPVKSLKAE
jgi:putative ABC transport system permease protein